MTDNQGKEECEMTNVRTVTLTRDEITAEALSHLKEGARVEATFRDGSRLDGPLRRRLGDECSFFTGPTLIFYDSALGLKLGATFKAHVESITIPAPPRVDGWYQLRCDGGATVSYRYDGGEWVDKFGDRISSTGFFAELEDKATWIGPIR